MRRTVLVAVLAGGCGFRVAGGGEADAAGAGRDAMVDAPAIDAAIDAPPAAGCIGQWLAGTVQLTNPTQLLQLGSPTADDRDPYVSADGLRLYFASDRVGSAGGSDVYFATRVSNLAAFVGQGKATDLSSATYDARVGMSGDGLIAVRSSDAGSNNMDLALATRGSLGTAFSTFSSIPFASVNDTEKQLDPELSPDGLRLYFSEGTTQRIVMVSRNTTAGAFGNAIDIVDSGAGDADPAVSSDERILVFASARSGNGDIYYATRPVTSQPFGTPVIVPTINSTLDSDGDPALSSDACTVYFASNRGTNADWELWASQVL